MWVISYRMAGGAGVVAWYVVRACIPLLFVAVAAVACGRLDYDARSGPAGDPDAAGTVERSWEELGQSATGGGVSNRGASARNLVLKISSEGVVHVAWSDESSGNQEIYLCYWDGSSWLGYEGSCNTPEGISNDAAESRLGDITFDSLDRPVVAWMSLDSSRSIYLMRWTGSTWEELGGSASGRGVSGNGNPWWPEIAVDDAGNPVVVWEMYNVASAGRAYVRRWTGTAWQGVGGSDSGDGVSGPGGHAQLTEIAVDSADRPTVVWQDDRQGSENVYLRRYNGSTWEELAGSGTAGGLSNSTASAVRVLVDVGAQDDPVVVWSDDRNESGAIKLLRWTGSAWEQLGGSDTGTGVAGAYAPGLNPGLSVDPSGAPVVAWDHEHAGGHDVFAARWNGSQWDPLFAGDPGVSDTANRSEFPRLATAPDGTIYLGWEEDLGGGAAEIYLRYLLP